MENRQASSEPLGLPEVPPFLYEIRVKGRLSSEQWTSWFDDLTVASRGGESILQGRAPDHSALYALLARLRDLAVPLVAVRVLDAQAQSALRRQSRRDDLMINLLLAAIYLVLLGALAAITVFVAPVIHTALALALLFASLGGLAHVFWLWSGKVIWRWITYVTWPAAALTFVLYIVLSGLLPTELGIAVMLLLVAGALVYLAYVLRRRAEKVKGGLVQWDTPARDARPTQPLSDPQAPNGEGAGED